MLIYVRMVNLPVSCKAFCLRSPDGGYDVYISDHLTPLETRRALEHELAHIYRNDFEKPVMEAEKSNNGMKPRDLSEIIFCGST